MRIFYASALDYAEDAQSIEAKVRGLCERHKHRLLSASSDSVIISRYAARPLCKQVAAQDLRIQRKCEATLVYTDLKTFAVGTWCEMWEAKKLGQMVIVLTPSPPQTIRSVFIKAYADYIVDWSSLEEVLEKCI